MTLCGGNAVVWSSSEPMLRARIDRGVYVWPRTVTAGVSGGAPLWPAPNPRTARNTTHTLVLPRMLPPAIPHVNGVNSDRLSYRRGKLLDEALPNGLEIIHGTVRLARPSIPADIDHERGGQA